MIRLSRATYFCQCPAGASLASPYSVSTLPLIKPDVQFSRIRLSDKDSCVRPRNVAVAQVESDKTQLSVDVFVGITRDRLSRHNLVLSTQPPPHLSTLPVDVEALLESELKRVQGGVQ